MKESPSQYQIHDLLKGGRKTSDILQGINETLEDIRHTRSTWEGSMARWYRRRHGMKTRKGFPWPGASNLHFPLIDRTIKRLKAAFIGLIAYVFPIATIYASHAELGRKIEHFLDWLWRIRMDPMRAVMACVDSMLTYGKGVLKVTWRHEVRTVTDKRRITDITERLPGEVTPDAFREFPLQQLFPILGKEFDLDAKDEDDREIMQALVQDVRDGAEELVVEKEVTVHDEPQVSDVHPVDIFVTSSTTSIADATFIAHRMRLPLNTLRQRNKSGFYKNVQKIIEYAEADEGPDRSEEFFVEQDQREDVSIAKDTGKNAEVFEVYFYYDWNNDGVGEPCVLTYHKETDTILRFIEYPYAHGQWPFVDFESEVTDGRWYSPRGYAQQLEALQVEINAQHNAKIDAMTLTNAPIGFYARNSGFEPEDMTWAPGTFIPLQDPSRDIVFPVMPSHEISYEREEQSLKLWAEEQAGTLDAAITQPSQTMERRTATEIEAVQAQVASMFSLDAAYFQTRMRHVYRQVLALWQQYGDDMTEIRVTGEDQPIQFSRELLMGQYDLVPTGTPGNSTETARLGRTLQFLQIVSQSAGQIPGLDYVALIRRVAQQLDYHMAREVIKEGGETGDQAQYEEQINEIVRMLTLPDWYEDINPDDNHMVHARAVQDFLSRAAQQNQGNPAMDRIMRHGLEHQAQIQGMQPGQTQQAIQQQMPLAQPRMRLG